MNRTYRYHPDVICRTYRTFFLASGIELVCYSGHSPRRALLLHGAPIVVNQPSVITQCQVLADEAVGRPSIYTRQFTKADRREYFRRGVMHARWTLRITTKPNRTADPMAHITDELPCSTRKAGMFIRLWAATRDLLMGQVGLQVIKAMTLEYRTNGNTMVRKDADSGTNGD